MLRTSTHHDHHLPANKYRLGVLAGLALVLLGCRYGSTSVQPPSPTPVVIRFNVQEETALTDGRVVRPETIDIVPLTGTEDQPTLSLSVTPVDTPLPSQPNPTIVPDAPTASQATSAETAISQPPPPGNLYSGPLTHTIELLDPAPGFTVPAGVNYLEFKWAWHGQEIHPCQLSEGYGFAIRVWTNPANSNLPTAVRQTVQPLGVADFAAVQEEIAASCDPETGIRRYALNGLKNAPGVALVGGSGHFFWDVAYAQLEPYYVDLGVASPREFFILADGPTPALPVVMPSPTPAFPLTPRPRPPGQVVLVKPEDGVVYPVPSGPVQFEWRWEGPAGTGCEIAVGYGFEVRIGSKQPGFVPLGVLDAVKDQALIQCDPVTGVFSLVVPDLITTPGVVATYQGEYRWDGQFWWDVALVSISPYRPPETASVQRGFELSLHRYTGPVDRFGGPLRCSQLITWAEAQALFLALGGPDNDPNDLDPDGNQLACDELRQ